MVRHITRNKDTNSLQAAVLGANDGIVSIAGLVIGMIGAQQSKLSVITTGLAGIAAGAMSMAVGEYVAASAIRDQQKVLLLKERKDLRDHPQQELNDLVEVYESDGLTPKIAKTVAKEFTKADAFAVHADVDLHIDSKRLTNPLSAGLSSATAFIAGALVPMIGIALPPRKYEATIAAIAVILALIFTGILSAKATGVSMCRSALRIVGGGVLAMLVTFVIGNFVHTIGI